MSTHGMSSEQASKVKKDGHKREEKFNRDHGNLNETINYSGASSDCNLYRLSSAKLISDISQKIGSRDEDHIKISLKGGRTIQIHLGKVPELTSSNFKIEENIKKETKVFHEISFFEQEKVLKSTQFWNKYLAKGEILCYDNDEGKRTYFNMNHVVQFVIDHFQWRLLDTGRIKGDFVDPTTNSIPKGFKGIFTYEYRSEKKCFVLGAHTSSKGKQFIQTLEKYIPNFVENY